jgi:hypothetical protein
VTAGDPGGADGGAAEPGAAGEEATHWYAWHRHYDDLESSLSARLGVVQEHIRRFLDDAPAGPLRAVSVCAGQSRDLLGVLVDHPRARDVAVRAVEADPQNVAEARRTVHRLGLTGFEVREGDASVTDAYAGAVPADLVLVCGVFGNVDDGGVERAIHLLPQLCARGSVLVWTRHRRPPDLTPTIRRWFGDAGFEDLAFEAPAAHRFGVGVARWASRPPPFQPGCRLFDFTGDGHLPA